MLYLHLAKAKARFVAAINFLVCVNIVSYDFN